ncbi:hypothetical protein T06_12076 [Trichinella sp. T6]|nr:hypothetical protein T06_12076 [Trichinella sp. T6]
MPSIRVRRERKETIEQLKFCIDQSRLAGWVPAKTASSGMFLVNPFVSSIGEEAQ